MAGGRELAHGSAATRTTLTDGRLHRDAARAFKAPKVSFDNVLTVRISVCSERVLAVRLADSSWSLVTGYDPTIACPDVRIQCNACALSCPDGSLHIPVQTNCRSRRASLVSWECPSWL